MEVLEEKTYITGIWLDTSKPGLSRYTNFEDNIYNKNFSRNENTYVAYLLNHSLNFFFCMSNIACHFFGNFNTPRITSNAICRPSFFNFCVLWRECAHRSLNIFVNRDMNSNNKIKMIYASLLPIIWKINLETLIFSHDISS